jgi:hypothetical protein
MPKTRYARSGEARIAYPVIGALARGVGRSSARRRGRWLLRPRRGSWSRLVGERNLFLPGAGFPMASPVGFLVDSERRLGVQPGAA